MLHGVLKPATTSKLLLAFLGLYFVAAYYVTDGRHEGLPTGQLLMTLLLLGLVGGVAYNRKYLLIGATIAVPAIALTWFGRLSKNEPVEMVGGLLQVLLLGFVSWLTATHLWRQRKVTGETLRLAVIAYLLIGFTFAAFYTLAEYVDHRSFGGVTHEGAESSIAEMLYFSFVTMSTLGYGDITPKTPIARTAAMLHALIGQAYMAFIVAKLVSLYWAQSMADQAVEAELGEELDERTRLAEQMQAATKEQAAKDSETDEDRV